MNSKDDLKYFVHDCGYRVGIKKKYCFVKKKLIILISKYNDIVYDILFFHRSTSLLEYYRQRDRHISFALIIWKVIFSKKQFVKMKVLQFSA